MRTSSNVEHVQGGSPKEPPSRAGWVGPRLDPCAGRPGVGFGIVLGNVFRRPKLLEVPVLLWIWWVGGGTPGAFKKKPGPVFLGLSPSFPPHQTESVVRDVFHTVGGPPDSSQQFVMATDSGEGAMPPDIELWSGPGGPSEPRDPKEGEGGPHLGPHRHLPPLPSGAVHGPPTCAVLPTENMYPAFTIETLAPSSSIIALCFVI